ncbi:MAG: MBL fold metallo-hydrolase [Bacteroidales bacterium]|nr:MBL fold metallo-hydrolase [Bacteroidales bacterium]
MMTKVKQFTFNPFQVNTYILSDETGECAIIDPGMNTPKEEQELSEYIKDQNLKPVLLLNTHTHIDHIAGNEYVQKTYQLPLQAHRESEIFLREAMTHAAVFGIHLEHVTPIEVFLAEGDRVTFGNTTMQILYTPGHAAGSVCFYVPESGFVITGDVLFYQSIGRTDLATGDYDLLQESIWKKLFTLPDNTLVYPGHGPHTTVGTEKSTNPFVAIGRDELY